MTMPGLEEIQFVDLRGADGTRRHLLQSFIALYNETFTAPSEREDPAQWEERLVSDLTPPQPRTHLLAAVRKGRTGAEELAGGLIFEYYRTSGCGLLTYLVVTPPNRRLGLGRALVQKALEILRSDAMCEGRELAAVFAETENPELTWEGGRAMPPRERLGVLAALGARRVMIPYVQPPLIGGGGSARHLLLVAFPHSGHLAPVLPADVVRNFLHEFNRALGIDNPAQDPDFQAQCESLRVDPPLQPLADCGEEHVCSNLRDEDPVLQLARAAVSLHFVDTFSGTATYPDCPVFRSMELDLLSYRYQVAPPFGSRCENPEPIPVEIIFPDEFDYHSEGRTMRLRCSQPLRSVVALLSSTTFFQSGIRVWHLTLAPAEGTTFSEFDIIKLIHLYDGRTEKTEMARKVRFRCRDGSEVPIVDLLTKLAPGPFPVARLKAGTVEICTGTADAAGISHSDLLEAVRSARQEDGQKAHARVATWMQNGDIPGRTLMAYCGIVTGIFDFEEVDTGEVLDTLEPTFADAGTMLRIHRCTLVCMTDDDRAMEECRRTIGISPYLIIPHAVLLHNEQLVDEAEGRIDSVTECPSPLRELEKARTLAERNLNRIYLQNVFNYVTERTLFERGSEGRGSVDKLASTRNKLSELEARVKAQWEKQRDRGQMAITILLALLSLMQVKEAYFDLVSCIIPIEWRWASLCFVAACMALLIRWVWGRRPNR
jgi:GNAT superfamily N-acetyltransferase